MASTVEVMRKRQLAEKLSAKTGAKLKVSLAVVDFLIDEIATAMVKGVKVNIKDFGIFVKSQRAARMGRNPATGQAMKIKASTKARFTASKTLKEAMTSKKYPLHAELSLIEACPCAGTKPAAAKAAAPKAAKPAAKPAAKAVKPAAKKAAPAKKAPAPAKKAPAKRR